MSVEPLDRSLQNFVCISSVAADRSSAGVIVIRYVLPVLWMTSRQQQRCDTGAESDVSECLVSVVLYI